MKFLFDLLPILLFFITFKVVDIYAATAVAMAATVAQILWVYLKYKHVEKTQWISLALIIVFGGLTLGFQDKTFIQWKPSILYWVFAVGLWASNAFWKKNLIELAAGQQVTLKTHNPKKVWDKANLAWCLFFLVMGILNLYVAYSYDEDTWVNFKLFGGMGLLFVFIIAQGVWLNQYVDHQRS